MPEIGHDHPALNGPFDDWVGQATNLLPPHLAARVKNIYLRARWRVWKIYRKHQEQKDKRMGFN